MPLFRRGKLPGPRHVHQVNPSELEERVLGCLSGRDRLKFLFCGRDLRAALLIGFDAGRIRNGPIQHGVQQIALVFLLLFKEGLQTSDFLLRIALLGCPYFRCRLRKVRGILSFRDADARREPETPLPSTHTST